MTTHGRGHTSTRQRARKPAHDGADAADAATGSALALLDRALAGDFRALQALRQRLDLPGPHEGAAKCERSKIVWWDSGVPYVHALGLQIPIDEHGQLRLPAMRLMQEGLRRLAQRTG
jgi:hypothetical protein